MIDSNNIIIQNNNKENVINIINLNEFDDIPVYDLNYLINFIGQYRCDKFF